MRPEWGQDLDSATLHQLQKHIREALNHLHDPAFLRKSPLAPAFGVSARSDTPSALRGILVSAVEGLKPLPDEPAGTRAWEVFQSLYYRYVEQFSQDDVARQMGISLRQLRRLQQSALEALAYRLAEQFHLQRGYPPPLSPESAPAVMAVGEEMEWLRTSPPEETTDLAETLPAVIDLLRPLAKQRGVAIETVLEDDLPRVAAHPIAVRQALLNVFTVAVLNSPPASNVPIRLVARATQGQVHITSDWLAMAPAVHGGSTEDQLKIEFAQRLADLSSARLQLVTEGKRNRAEFTFSALAQRSVLVIDDNAQTLQLLHRYAAGTRYRVAGIQDVSEALTLLEATPYEVIVVDVMMPHLDGWTVLAELRRNAHTAATPIIVCTVLPQRELALSLGANDFLQKPVSRQAFLRALDRQISFSPPGPCPRCEYKPGNR